MKSKNNQQNTIEKTVIRFEKSETFKGSERNIRILKFLVDCYLKDIHVKESVLELELFGDSDQSVSYDGKVRVYMFNLRKKLDEYYRTEGANDSIIFEIQKGQYNLSIKQGTKTTKIRSKRINEFSIYAIIPLLIIISTLIHTDFSPSYCWKPFIDKNDASLCCVGDHFIIYKTGEDGKRVTSYLGYINSDNDFENFLKQDEANQAYSKAPFSFSTKMGPVSTAYLTEFFVKKKGSISVVMESEMSIENLQNNNIIYVGPFRTMDVFSDLFLSESGKFSYDGKNIVDTETNQQIKDTHINQSRLDHVMVSFKQLTDKGHYIIFFAGNNDIGVQAAVKNFTNKKWLKEFYTHIPHKNSQFNALFTVKGIGRTELECELEKVEILKQ